MLNAKITGTGMYVPKKILDNAYFAEIVDTTDIWIRQMTGIQERRVVTSEKAADLATGAAFAALKRSGLEASHLDLIIVSTTQGDLRFPACASIVQDRIKATHAAAFDLNSGCTGFISALSIATGYIRSGMYRKIMVIGMEVLSRVTDYLDRKTCILFGDGAGAVILEETHNNSGIIDVNLFSDGSMGNLLYCEKMPSGKELLRMEGNKIFKHAVEGMVSSSKDLMKKHNLHKDDINIIIPHQANERIIRMVAEKMELDMSKIFMNISHYGNMSSATIPIALTEALKKDLIKIGDLVLLTAFGAGLTWGSALIRW